MYHSGRRSAGGTRLPSANFTNLKTVEVGRGRNGYGFTIAGQHPCVLSCIMPNTPAEAAMLKAGDCVIAINGENVTLMDHEQFIKCIGETSGVLRLTVADMLEEAESEFLSNGNYQHPTAGAIVRARTSTPGIERTQMVLDELNSGALFRANPAGRAHFTQQMYYGEPMSDQRIVTPTSSIQDKFAPGHLSPFNRSSQQIALRDNPQDDHESFWDGQSKVHIDPVTRYKNRERLRALSKRSYYVQEDPFDEGEEGTADDDNRPLTPHELENITYHGLVDVDRHDLIDHMEEEDSPLVRAVVGYLGSVDIPATANLPTASLQAIRGSVRRLRVEQRVHSLMMMHISSSSGIRLISASSQVAVTYPADKIVFSGICPDDKRCFGVVTVQNVSPRPELEENDEQIGSACHVFIVDPELCSHDMHEEISLRFSLNCMPNPETHTCVDYPASSRVVLHHVSQFYQDRRDSAHFGDFYGQSPYIGFSRRSNSGSSNSDSGFGTTGREALPISNNSDQIVDVASHIRNQRANRTSSSQKQNLANQHRGLHGSLSNHHNSQANMNYDLSGSSSTGSGELTRINPVLRGDLEERLMPRARPQSMMAPSRHFEDPPIRSASVSVFEMSSSVPQRDVRRQPLRALNLGPGWENALEPGSYHLEPAMSDPFGNGLSPTSRSQYLHQPRHTMASLRRGSDCSDYNTAQLNARRNALQRAQQKLNTAHHKRTSLTASDSELNTIDEPQTLRHDENTASQADLADESPPAVGRVSGWAVSFERLLKDELGLAYFTDFLKQEFSEENILFWISCEQLSKISDRAELKEKAETIYRRFLSSYATMPVNLEGNYRQMVENAIKDPTPEMYRDQQSQIFKLMKLDSYSRFLKSKLYQDCVLSEMGNLPMPSIESQSITELCRPEKGGPQATPTPPSNSSAESTLEKKPKNRKAEKLGKNKQFHSSLMDLRPSKTSTISYFSRDSYLKYFGRKTKMAQGKELVEVPQSPNRQTSEEKKRSLLPWFKGLGGKRNASATRPDIGRETQFYVTSPSADHPHIPMSHSDTQIAKQGYHDSMPRTRSMSQFSALFPNNIIITIKVIPDKTIGEVLLPLCEEQGLTQQTAEIFLKTTKGGLLVKEKLIDLTQDVSALGGREIVIERRVVFKIELPCKRLIGVKSKPTKKLIEVLRPVTFKYSLQLDKLVVHLNNSPIPLDLEITVAALDNQRIMVETFEQYSAGDVRNGKGNPHPKPPSTPQSKENNSPMQKRASKATNEKAAMEKPMPPPQAGHTGGGNIGSTVPPSVQQNNNNRQSNLQMIDEVDEASDLYRLVAKANRRRLDDQRGLTLRNLEVPDFLVKEPDNPSSQRPQTALGISEAAENRRNRETDLRPTSTPPRQAPPPGSGFATGTLPTHEEATALFGGVNGLDNLSFGESLGSSGYPDSIPDTSRSPGEPGMSPKQYRIRGSESRESTPNRGGHRSNYHPKISGISIMSEADIPRSPSSELSPGPFRGSLGSLGGSQGFDLDLTLTAQDQGTSQNPGQATAPNHDEWGSHGDLSEPPPPYSEKPATLPRRGGGGNNNYLKTLFEESNSSQKNSPNGNSRQRVVKKPAVAPKPQARRSNSLPVEEKVITVIGADGQQHQATFV